MSLNPIASIAEGIIGGLGELFTSDDERAKAKLKLEELFQQPHILQAMANIEEAKHHSIFVAGWRPAIGWVCVLGLSYQFLILPFAGIINAYLAPDVMLPNLDSGTLMTLVLSLLGLGGLRTAEKFKGVARSS